MPVAVRKLDRARNDPIKEGMSPEKTGSSRYVISRSI